MSQGKQDYHYSRTHLVITEQREALVYRASSQEEADRMFHARETPFDYATGETRLVRQAIQRERRCTPGEYQDIVDQERRRRNEENDE